VSLWVNGIDPGFANDWLPLMLTSVCERIDEVRCFEILNYATYDQPMVCSTSWASAAPGRGPHAAAADGADHGLGQRGPAAGGRTRVELDAVEEHYVRLPAPETFAIASGTIEKGTVAGLRFEVRGWWGPGPSSSSST